jgi:hypothetical protein
MIGPEATGESLRQEARMVMHEDEHAIIKAMLWKVLGDDDCYATVVSSDPSESGRAEDRLVLARFLARMERQFKLRANGRRRDRRVERSRIEVYSTQRGNP